MENYEIFKKITFLFVEDEEEVRREIFEILAPFFKKIYLAKDGVEGLKLFKEHKDIDLVVTDIMMPKMNGIEMVDEIRKIDKEVPIIYTTAFNDAELILKTVKQMISGYILKPINIEELLEGIIRAYDIVEAKELRKKLSNLNLYLKNEIEKKTAELEKLAFFDQLTGLPNRNSLIRDLKKLKEPIVIVIDIDSFKTINDLYGVEVGNYVLREFAHVLKILSKKFKGEFYRAGSDEFVFLKDHIFNEEECRKILDKLQKFISTLKISYKDEIEIFIDATAGLSYGKDNTLEKADMALNKAREHNLKYYILKEDEKVHTEYKYYIETINKIKKSIKESKVEPYFQPIVDKEKNVIYYEALMRIEIDGEILTPNKFLDISKKAKQYVQLSNLMVDKALNISKELDLTISINLSYQDIENSKNINFIIDRLKYYDLGEKVIFEITEEETIKDFENMVNIIKVLKDYGVKIAIDDFGSGYSNFAYLLKLEPDFIKIDGTLIKEIAHKKEAEYIVETISHFSKKLNIKTVAEYVYNEDVFEKAKNLKIDNFQGYYFCEPKKLAIKQ